MAYCPNISDSQVVKDFNSIVEHFGGRSISQEEFRDPVLRDSRAGVDKTSMESAYYLWNKYAGNLSQIKEDSNYKLSSVKEGVDFIFQENPELNNIGTQQQYSQYLDMIFPDSKVKDIVYHGTDSKEKILEKGFKNNAELFEPDDDRAYEGGELGFGYYFTTTQQSAKNYGEPVAVILNNPDITNETTFNLITNEKGIQHFVKTKEQIHILGSKQDVEGFKEFVESSDMPSTGDFLKQRFSRYLIKEIGAIRQESVCNHIARTITKEIIANPDRNINEIRNEVLARYKQEFIEDRDYFESSDEVDKDRFLEFYNPLISNFDTVARIVNTKVQKINNLIGEVNDDLEIDLVEVEDNEKINSDKSAYETKVTLSAEIKRLFADIDAPNRNILGEQDVMDYTLVDAVVKGLVSNLPQDYELMKAKMLENKEAYPWITQLVNKLDNSGEKIQNMFVTEMNHHYVKHYMAMWQKVGNKFEISMVLANENAIEGQVVSNWKSNLTSGNSVDVNGVLVKRDELLKRYTVFQESKNPEEVRAWLNDLGVSLGDKSWNDIVSGNYVFKSKDGKVSFEKFISSDYSPIVHLAKKLKSIGDSSVEEFDIYADSSIGKLAKHEARFTTQVLSNSHRAGGKTVYSYGKNKYVVDFVRELKQSNLAKDILDKSGSFNSESIILKAFLDKDTSFTENFEVSTVSLQALKKFGSKDKDGLELNNLGEDEYEIQELSGLYSPQQDVTSSNKRVGLLNFLTCSDKSTAMIVRTVLQNIGFNSNATLNNDSVNKIYTQCVLPEIKRIKQWENMVKTNTKFTNSEFKNGGHMFYLIPSLNNLEGMWNSDGTININVESVEFRNSIENEIKRLIDKLVQDKLALWEKYGITKNGQAELLDFRTMQSFKLLEGLPKESYPKAMATDMVYQYMLGNANFFTGIVGDPAKFYKSKVYKKSVQELIKNDLITLKQSSDIALVWSKLAPEQKIKIIQEVYDNVGKRLAMYIAPGKSTADYEGEVNYIFVKDKMVDSLNLEQYKTLLGEDKAKDYSKKGTLEEGTNAQEFTTFLEHLYVMDKSGLLPTGFYREIKDIVSNEISNGNFYYTQAIKDKLSEDSLKFFNDKLVCQVMKPVYSWFTVDETGVTPMYIKTSSYPLLPELTANKELDKVRVMMEKNGLQRLSFPSGTKLGMPTEPIALWDENGNVREDISSEEILKGKKILPRMGFRLQQEVPYDALKDYINRVSQADKNLFINLLDIDGFEYEGQVYKGEELQKVYEKYYGELYKLGYDELVDELSIKFDEAGNVVEFDKKALKDILLEEAVKRDYALNDIEALDLDEALDYIAFMPSANKYEALLNAIVKNRVLQMKFKGKSFVLSTEEGYQSITGDNALDGVIYTDKWQGTLDPGHFEDSEGNRLTGEELKKAWKEGTAIVKRPAQVLMPWKFKDDNGKLHIEDYVNKETGKIDTSKLPEELMQLFGMRIPNQGPNSQSWIEVAGFLPKKSGDIIVATRDYLAQMGSDFDVDKFYTYMYNYSIKNGKLKKVDYTSKDAIRDETRRNELWRQSLQNKLLDIHLALHKNTDKTVQYQISEPLGFWEFKDIADEIAATQPYNPDFTALSDAYQRTKRLNASMGKTGCLGINTKVLMFDGKFKNVQDIIVGDNLMGIDSTPRKVLSLKRGVEQMYVIKQKRGDDYRVNESHILSLIKSMPPLYSQPTVNGVRIIDKTKILREQKDEIINIKLSDYLNTNSNFRNSTFGYKSEGINFPEQPVSIDPYYIGLWIGDGRTNDIKEIANIDIEVIEYLESNYGIKCQYGPKNIARRCYPDKLNKQFKHEFSTNKVGLMPGCKYIPDQYLYNTKDVRLKLLAGIIDTDGSYCRVNKQYRISTVLPMLKEQIMFLTRSLGFYTSVQTIPAHISDAGLNLREKYIINFIPECDIPVLIERKKQIVKSNFKNRLKTHIDIIKDTVDDYYGFELDGDHLFMLGDLTITHNTGDFSNLAMFNAASQGKNLYLRKSDGSRVFIRFGDIVSNGDLSDPHTIKTQKKINENSGLDVYNKVFKSQVIAGLQSAAVDNEKEQILDKLNLSKNTFRYAKLLAQLGFENEVAYFMRQPIIVDYFNELKRLRSSLGAYTPNAEELAENFVMKKYKTSSFNDKLYDENFAKGKGLSSANMKNSIINPDANFNYIQIAAFEQMQYLKKYADDLQEIQSAINTDSKGLDKSLFETLSKEDAVDNMNQKSIANTYALLDNTINGFATDNGLRLNNKLWSNLFPYRQHGIVALFEIIEKTINKSDVGIGTRAALRSNIWKEFKSYMFSLKELGLYGDVDIKAERERLFIDSDTNKSLASKVKEIQKLPEFVNHPFLSRLVPATSKGIKPSIIKMNTGIDPSAELLIVQAATDLYVNDRKIPGLDMTTKQLFEELVKASYLSGGIQEFVQYIKYMPVAYLFDKGFAENISNKVRTKFFEDLDKLDIPGQGAPYWALPTFVIQYLQHDQRGVQTLAKVGYENDIKIMSSDKSHVTSVKVEKFSLTNSDYYIDTKNGQKPPVALVIPSTGRVKGLDDNVLFLHTGEKDSQGYPIYTRLSNKGSFAFSEYNFGVKYDKSSIESYNSISELMELETRYPENKDVSDTFENPEHKEVVVRELIGVVDEGNVNDIKKMIGNIAIYSDDKFQQVLAVEFNKHMDKLDTKFTTNFHRENANGMFWRNTVHINMDADDNKTLSGLSQSILHETTHGFVNSVLKQYESNPGSLSGDTKKAVADLRRLQSIYISRTKEKFGVRYNEMLDIVKAKKYELIEDRGDLLEVYAANPDKLQEFIALAISNPEIQQVLNDINDPNAKERGLLDRFVDIVQNLLNSLGFDVKKGSLLGGAIQDTLVIIKGDNNVNVATSMKAEQPSDNSGFQGYKGGFENTGKGTVVGDGKDKAMRIVANAFVGELYSKAGSSTLTSATEIGRKHNENPSVGNKVFIDGKGVGLHEIYVAPISLASQKIVVMLARNSKLAGQELSPGTMRKINGLHKTYNAEFVVGDMPNVDSQFIDYMQEIGAKFTMYHTGTKPRIDLEKATDVERVSEDFLPATNSKEQTLKDANELNVDGTSKKYIMNDTNYKRVFKKAQDINKSQAFYKATVGTTYGEDVIRSGRQYYYIRLEQREISIKEKMNTISDAQIFERLRNCR